jgi:hypothetical protein
LKVNSNIQRFLLTLSGAVALMLVLVPGAAFAAAGSGTAPHTAPASSTASARGTHSQAITPHPRCTQNGVAVSGGFCAVPAHESVQTHVQLNAAGLEDLGIVFIHNYKYPVYVVTLQPSDGGGRHANHLYMWADNGWSTQKWEMYYDPSNSTYVFQSKNNGKCINVPGSSSTPGTQLIVYSCDGYPNDERFYRGSVGGSIEEQIKTYYNANRFLSIGSDFPGNGAWVIIYNFTGSVEQYWTMQDE